jgi:hypothetical protein
MRSSGDFNASITVDRDSVCAGDDFESHERSFAAPLNASVPELIQLAINACVLAEIAGGNATWIVEAGGYDGKPIAVVAQQWKEPRLLVPETATAEGIFDGHKPKLFFKYWSRQTQMPCSMLLHRTALCQIGMVRSPSLKRDMQD